MLRDKLKIGYFGIRGSFDNMAALELSDSLGVLGEDVILFSCDEVDIEHTDVDYVVARSEFAFESHVFEKCDEFVFHPHHSLFVKNENIGIIDVRNVMATPKTLMDCFTNIRDYFTRNHVALMTIEDDVEAANRLREIFMFSDIAVLCPKAAGEMNHLHLIEDKFEDDELADIHFVVYKKKGR